MRRLRFLAVPLLLLGIACSNPKPRLSALGDKPDWDTLLAFQESLTPAEFQAQMVQAFSYDDAWAKYFRLQDSLLEIQTGPDPKSKLRLTLAKEKNAKQAPPRYWRPSPLKNPTPDKPLLGLRIALDPGHLGGDWARMEGRWFKPEGFRPIKEGDLTLQVAKILKTRLEAWGAEVFLTRDTSEPVTTLRPMDLEEKTQEYLEDSQDLNLNAPQEFTGLPREEQIRRISELLFYRVAEIRARAASINEKFRPDLTVCLHFNAGDWGNPEAPTLAASNHLHILIPGAVESEEWALEDIRFESTRRILDGSHAVEQRLAESIAKALADSTRLMPALVPGGSVKKVGENPYVWSRNLLATRLYQNPTVFIEAYVMNHPEVVARIEAGDFSGRRKIGDQEHSSIFQDYAEGLAQGILDYFRQ